MLCLMFITAAKDENKGNTETSLINELLGPDAKYDRRARPQFNTVNISLLCMFETILKLVNSSFISLTMNRNF